MHLDSLYREGALEALSNIVDADIIDAPIENGSRLYFSWDDGSTMKIDCTQNEVNFLSLVSKRKGLYTELCDNLPNFFSKCGVIKFRATTVDKDAERILRKRGNWDAEMVWVL